MNEENMGKITIKLSNDAEKQLRDRAERNKRSISKEVEFIVETLEKQDTDILKPFYPGTTKESKDKVK